MEWRREDHDGRNGKNESTAARDRSKETIDNTTIIELESGKSCCKNECGGKKNGAQRNELQPGEAKEESDIRGNKD